MNTLHHQSADRRASGMPNGLDNRCFTVIVAGECFGLPVSCVHTIFRIEAVTPVPLGPREVVGLVNLRGKIVTAVSLRLRLGLPRDETYDNALAIGIEHGTESFALVVDEVGDVITLDEDDRIASPPHMSSSRAALTKTVYRLPHGILPVLDMKCVFEFSRKGGVASPNHNKKQEEVSS